MRFVLQLLIHNKILQFSVRFLCFYQPVFLSMSFWYVIKSIGIASVLELLSVSSKFSWGCGESRFEVRIVGYTFEVTVLLCVGLSSLLFEIYRLLRRVSLCLVKCFRVHWVTHEYIIIFLEQDTITFDIYFSKFGVPQWLSLFLWLA